MDLHDATLVSVAVDWAAGSILVRVKPSRGAENTDGIAEIRAYGLRHLEVPRLRPWGPSVSVNHVDDTDGRLSIEMQSGDTIVIEAERFSIPD